MLQREKNLALGVGGLLGLLLLWFAYDGISAAFSRREAQLDNLRKKLSGRETQIKLAREQTKKLRTLEQMSLPTDRDVATSLYQHWLESLVEKSKFSNWGVRPTGTVAVKDGGFEKLTFSLNADGSLEGIVAFLFDFYRADSLHKIQGLSIKASDSDKKSSLQLQLSVEALVLSTAARKDGLNSGESKRLLESEFAKYKDAIVGRNLFAAYKPPPPPTPPRVERVVEAPAPPPRPREPDPAAFAKVTSILASEKDAEVWILAQLTGKTLKLRVGDTFDVGTVKGEITAIDQDRVEMNLNGARTTVLLGQNLRDAASTLSTSTAAPGESPTDSSTPQ